MRPLAIAGVFSKILYGTSLVRAVDTIELTSYPRKRPESDASLAIATWRCIVAGCASFRGLRAYWLILPRGMSISLIQAGVSSYEHPTETMLASVCLAPYHFCTSLSKDSNSTSLFASTLTKTKQSPLYDLKPKLLRYALSPWPNEIYTPALAAILGKSARC